VIAVELALNWTAEGGCPHVAFANDEQRTTND